MGLRGSNSLLMPWSRSRWCLSSSGWRDWMERKSRARLRLSQFHSWKIIRLDWQVVFVDICQKWMERLPNSWGLGFSSVLSAWLMLILVNQWTKIWLVQIQGWHSTIINRYLDGKWSKFSFLSASYSCSRFYIFKNLVVLVLLSQFVNFL